MQGRHLEAEERSKKKPHLLLDEMPHLGVPGCGTEGNTFCFSHPATALSQQPSRPEAQSDRRKVLSVSVGLVSLPMSTVEHLSTGSRAICFSVFVI